MARPTRGSPRSLMGVGNTPAFAGERHRSGTRHRAASASVALTGPVIARKDGCACHNVAGETEHPLHVRQARILSRPVPSNSSNRAVSRQPARTGYGS